MKNIMLRAFAVVLAMVPAVASAQDLSSDRPDFTEGATIVVRPQIEAGYTFTRAGRTDQHAFGEVLLRLGVAQRVELRLAANSYQLDRGDQHSRGLEDADITAKLRFANKPAIALIVGSGLPTGTAPDAGHGLSPEAVFVLEPSLGDKMGLGLNIGIASRSSGDQRSTEMYASASFDMDVTKRTQAYLETYGIRTTAGDSERSLFADAGLTHRLMADLQIDGRVGRRLDASGEWSIGAGVTRRF